MSEPKSKTLILCVDRDDDIGSKTGTKTPVIGREQNLSAASQLALRDPEESDANAIFGAVRTLDSLSSDAHNEEYAVATIAGSKSGGVRADKSLRDELMTVLKQFPADSIVLVTDGFSDEEVIPLVQSAVPIISVHRVVVKHSESIEESWAVFSRYVRRVVEDPYYARWVLGTPGIFFVILAIIWAAGWLMIAGEVMVFFIGAAFVVKGFGLDEKVERLIFPSPPNLIRLFTAITFIIVIGLAGYQTYGALYEELGSPSTWLSILPLVLALAIKNSVNLLLIASVVLSVGMAIYFYFKRDGRIWWSIVGIVAALWMREIALNASYVLQSPLPLPQSLVVQLLIVSILGIATTAIAILITLKLGKRFEHYFRRRAASDDEEG
jgi:putative membrane protein